MLGNMAPTSVLVTILLGAVASATDYKLGPPLMGWNSYNHYSCSPTEAIIKANAEGLITLGLDQLGYTYVTPDCGWNANYRDSSGQLVWDPTTFPSGGAALGEYIHGLGLKFGIYSGGGYYQCGSTNEPASLGMSRAYCHRGVFFRIESDTKSIRARDNGCSILCGLGCRRFEVSAAGAEHLPPDTCVPSPDFPTTLTPLNVPDTIIAIRPPIQRWGMYIRPLLPLPHRGYLVIIGKVTNFRNIVGQLLTDFSQ
jgi:hypothetical protein